MGQLIFMFAMLIAPKIVDWTDRMRQGEETNEAGGANEGHGGE